jgi:hypothetical protein
MSLRTSTAILTALGAAVLVLARVSAADGHADVDVRPRSGLIFAENGKQLRPAIVTATYRAPCATEGAEAPVRKCPSRAPAGS